MPERLQKILASAGVGSRRYCEGLIASGRVSVNGETARVGQSVEVEIDQLAVDGHPICPLHRYLYLALNKPAGYVTTVRSTRGELTVMGLLPAVDRVYPVGRLDKDTAGLLLFTNDGNWANLVTHPRYGIEKEYRVTVSGRPSTAELGRLEEGIELPLAGRTAPVRARVRHQEAGNTVLDMTLVEGKKRQIRLMCAAIGHPVLHLQRIRVGSIHLGRLAAGQTRNLTQQEVDEIRELARHSGQACP